MALLGCPFCQELVPSDEASECPTCGVALVPVEQLPPSYERRAREAERLLATPPEHRRLPWTYLGRGRGLLVLLALLSLGAFFLPWVHMTRPDAVDLSGFDLARRQAEWFWGGAIGWFILIPLVVSRRTLFGLRGIRAIATVFASMTLIEAVMLVANEPTGSRYVPVQLEWGAGLYLSAALSAIGVLVALRLGGRLDDITLPRSSEPLAAPPEESSGGETLH